MRDCGAREDDDDERQQNESALLHGSSLSALATSCREGETAETCDVATYQNQGSIWRAILMPTRKSQIAFGAQLVQDRDLNRFGAIVAFLALPRWRYARGRFYNYRPSMLQKVSGHSHCTGSVSRLLPQT